MKKNKLIILIVVLAVVCAGIFIVIGMEKHTEKIKNQDEVAFSFDADKATELSWSQGLTSFKLTKEGDKWYSEADREFPVSTAKVEELLAGISEYRSNFVIEDVKNYADYGLKTPSCAVKVVSGGKTYNLNFGDYSKIDAERYFEFGNGNVYMATTDAMPSFTECTESDLLQREDIPELDMLKELKFTGDSDMRVFYKRAADYTYSNEFRYYYKEDASYVPLGTVRTKAFVNTLLKMDITDYVEYKLADDTLAKYGLDQPTLTAYVDYLDEDENEHEYTIDMHRTGDTVYAHYHGSGIVYVIPTEAYEELIAKQYNDIRPPDLVTPYWTNVRALEFVLDGVSYTVDIESHVEDGQRQWKFWYKGEELDLAAIKDAFEDIQVEEYIDSGNGTKHEARVIIHQENEKFPTVKLDFYRYNGHQCLVKWEGKTYGLVARSEVINMVEQVYALVLGE